MASSDAEIVNNTIAFNVSYHSGGIHISSSSPLIERCIIAFNGDELHCINASYPTFTNCNVYTSRYLPRNWHCSPYQVGVDGNMNVDPLFCGATGLDLHLIASSPCAPENNPQGVLIGALPPSNCEGLSCGDIDRDGELTQSDVDVLVSLYFSLEWSELPFTVADLDCSGDISINDVVILAGFLYGYGPVPCCVPAPPPPPKRQDEHVLD